MVKWLAVAVIIAGVLLVLVGLGSDPFAVPFQDHDQMPEGQALAYEQASHASSATAAVGASVGLGGVALLIVGIVRHRRWRADAPVRGLDGSRSPHCASGRSGDDSPAGK